ncbi:MAG: tRNA (guanosine(46)-N7)-methyltransferase TrmB [Gammaproteobacteria bacterium]|nr:tRNA (guanosine(46)-N7)-methyltransferase TrmB [Gammaproteobacteria bacterium]
MQSIRNFVRRGGRITKGQKSALDRFWARYGIEISVGGSLNLKQIFGRESPVWLEIGFGDGEALVSMARRHPEIDFLGIEVHRPGIGHLLARLVEAELSNIRIINDDAVQILKYSIAASSLDRILLFFPDPWPKRRHHKRRIVQAEFLSLLHLALKVSGVFHMATDWKDYALQSLKVMTSSDGFVNIAGDQYFIERPDYRPQTKFERRGIRLGHGVWDLKFQRR